MVHGTVFVTLRVTNAMHLKNRLWSRHSRRIEPIKRSAYPFCQGERAPVG
jgi:hypothetical protein